MTQKNIYWQKNANQWMVRIKGNYLGTYNELDQAEKALSDFISANPAEKKFKVSLTLDKKQLAKFKKLGSQRWIKSLLT